MTSGVSDSELVAALRSDMSTERNAAGEYTDINSCVVCGIQWRDDSECESADAMIGCDECNRWYHGCCIGINVDTMHDPVFYCDACRQQRGLLPNQHNTPLRNLRTERLQQIDALMANAQRRHKVAQQLMHNKQSNKADVFSALLESLHSGDASDTGSSSDSDHDQTQQATINNTLKTSSTRTPTHNNVPSAHKPSSVKAVRRVSSSGGSAPAARLTGSSATSIRDKVREQLSSILNGALGLEIERLMYEHIDNHAVAAGYRQHFRDLVANLRDPNNAQLQQRILNGQLTPHQLVRMSGVELASPEVAQLRQSIKEDSLKMAILPADTLQQQHIPVTLTQIKRYDPSTIDRETHRETETTDSIRIATSATDTAPNAHYDGTTDMTASPRQPPFTDRQLSHDTTSPADVWQPLEPLQTFDESAALHTSTDPVDLPQLEQQSPKQRSVHSKQHSPTAHQFQLSEHLLQQNRVVWTGELCIPASSNTLADDHTVCIPLSCHQLSGVAVSRLPLPPQLHERHRISQVELQKYVTQVQSKSSSKRVVCVAFACTDDAYSASVQQIVLHYGTDRAMVFDYQHVQDDADRCLLYVLPQNAVSDHFLHTVLNVSRPEQALIGVCVVPVDVCAACQLPLSTMLTMTAAQIEQRQRMLGTDKQVQQTAQQNSTNHRVDARPVTRPVDPRKSSTMSAASEPPAIPQPSNQFTGPLGDAPPLDTVFAPTAESLTSLSTYLQNLIGANSGVTSATNTPLPTPLVSAPPVPVPVSGSVNLNPPPLTPAQFAALQAQRCQHTMQQHTFAPAVQAGASPSTPPYGSAANAMAMQAPYGAYQPAAMQHGPYQPTMQNTSLHPLPPASSYVSSVLPSVGSGEKRVKHHHAHTSTSIEPRLARLLLDNHLCKFYFTGKCSKDNCNYSHDVHKYNNVLATMYQQ